MAEKVSVIVLSTGVSVVMAHGSNQLQGVKAVLMDFGNVMGPFSYPRAYEAIARLGASQTPPLTAQRVEQALTESRLAIQYEQGFITTHELWTRLCEMLHLRKVLDANLDTAWKGIFDRNEPVIEAVKAIAPGVKVILASNTNYAHFEQFKLQFADAHARFDGFACSFVLKVMKPHPKFFEACIKLAKCAPDECVYVDDMAEYVEAASHLGIQGIVYTPQVDLAAEFRQRGILLEDLAEVA